MLQVEAGQPVVAATEHSEDDQESNRAGREHHCWHRYRLEKRGRHHRRQQGAALGRRDEHPRPIVHDLEAGFLQGLVGHFIEEDDDPAAEARGT